MCTGILTVVCVWEILKFKSKGQNMTIISDDTAFLKVNMSDAFIPFLKQMHYMLHVYPTVW